MHFALPLIVIPGWLDSVSASEQATPPAERPERAPSGRLGLAVSRQSALIGPHNVGAVIVCGSHGGAISGAFARKHPAALVLFNDAGLGKRRAGIASLEVLQR